MRSVLYFKGKFIPFFWRTSMSIVLKPKLQAVLDDGIPSLTITMEPIVHPGFLLTGRVFRCYETDLGYQISRIPADNAVIGDTRAVALRVPEKVRLCTVVFDGISWCELTSPSLYNAVSGDLTTSAFSSSAKSGRRRKIAQIELWLQKLKCCGVIKQPHGRYSLIQVDNYRGAKILQYSTTS
jgi:hypothetical protein